MIIYDGDWKDYNTGLFFVDRMARVTLQILGDLAAKTQVILFSHHRQIVEASSDITGKGSIHIHELEPPSPATLQE